MGLGKIIEAILTMFNYKDEPGLTYVVCPASLCPQWVKSINAAWKEGYGMKAFHLHDSRLSAHDIQGMGIDIIVSHPMMWSIEYPN